MAALTEEQTLIKDQAVSWVEKEAPVTKFREMRDGNVENRFLPKTWQQMVEMGWSGFIIPEEFGGSGLGYLTFGLVLEQAGRNLVASPLFASSLVGASAILLAGNQQQKETLLPKIADGSSIVTLALEEGPRHGPERINLSAEATDGGWVLNGEKHFVLEGTSADTLIVVARTSGKIGDQHGISLFAVPADVTGISKSLIDTVDSRGYASIKFEGVQVGADALMGEKDEGYPVLTKILDRARASLTAEMLGSASKAFEMTLEYLKTREQFGQVIGSFQALGHRAAGLFTQMELARSCAEAALQALDDGSDRAEELTSIAKVKVGEFLYDMSNELIQIHGGIGMTDEFDAGLYLKRARILESLYGNRAYHRDRFATLRGF